MKRDSKSFKSSPRKQLIVSKQTLKYFLDYLNLKTLTFIREVSA